MAWRPDHADQGPRRVPARFRLDGRKPGRRAARRPGAVPCLPGQAPGARIPAAGRGAPLTAVPHRHRALAQGARRDPRRPPAEKDQKLTEPPAHRRRPGRQPHRARLPPDSRAGSRDRPELGSGIPAQPAQAWQGAALPAGVLCAAARPGRLPQGGQRPEATAGCPWRVPGQRGAARGNPRAGRRDPRRAGGPRRYAAGHGRTRGPPRGAPGRSPRGLQQAVHRLRRPGLQRFNTLLGRADQ